MVQLSWFQIGLLSVGCLAVGGFLAALALYAWSGSDLPEDKETEREAEKYFGTPWG